VYAAASQRRGKHDPWRAPKVVLEVMERISLSRRLRHKWMRRCSNGFSASGHRRKQKRLSRTAVGAETGGHVAPDSCMEGCAQHHSVTVATMCLASPNGRALRQAIPHLSIHPLLFAHLCTPPPPAANVSSFLRGFARISRASGGRGSAIDTRERGYRAPGPSMICLSFNHGGPRPPPYRWYSS